MRVRAWVAPRCIFLSLIVLPKRAAVADAGGVVIRPKFSIGDFGFVCLAQDTEGNIIGFNSMK
jgi:predicted enzyme related to lactoylglutathione lyase